MDLNIPETRQEILKQRLRAGGQIVAADFATEFSISVDTVRRDIIALEHLGKAHRVRGGAVPVVKPSGPLQDRLSVAPPDALISRALERLDGCETILIDGGSTMLALARRLSPRSTRLVMTPSPWIAVTCQERGIDVFMLGGRLSASGGVNVGDLPAQTLTETAPEITVLGACGLDPGFGLSSDDLEESRLKAAMSNAAVRTIIVTDASKIGRRARYQTLATDRIDMVITDADEAAGAGFRSRGVETDHV